MTEPRFGYSRSSNDIGFDVGAGAISFFSAHFGLRAGIRHIRSLEENAAANPLDPFSTESLRFWRTSIGVVIR